ncbi:MAG: neuraminidase-like domain-containing protein [Acidimicrobiales bacterium]
MKTHGVTSILTSPISSVSLGQQSNLAVQATLETLFQNLDYCTCDDCQSITGPAAYLVDLLNYINVPSPSSGYSNPQDVLLGNATLGITGRRPDIGSLPLTCDNTNIALPYLDLANEILEYYVANSLSISGYAGYNDDGTVSSEDLIASPQNDDNTTAQAAYATLEATWFPSPLPFHRNLELLRGHVAGLQLDLSDLMRVLRADGTGLDAPTTGPQTYGWCDILIERLGLSRLDYRLLTDSSLTLADIYGYPTATADATVISSIQVLQEFSRRTGVAYSDIVSILQTSFINPDSYLIPRLDALGVSAQTVQDVYNGSVNPALAGALTPTQFAALLPAGLDFTLYGPTSTTGEDVAAWVIANYTAIMGLIVIDVAGDAADTTNMFLRYLNPTSSAQTLQPIEFVRLLRFIRLWQALGLTIQQTDDLIGALYQPTDPPSDTDLQKLDSGMQTALQRAGLLYEAMDLLGLDAADDIESVLPCWGTMSTTGPASLYAQLFLNPTVLGDSAAFQPAVDGSILSDPTVTVLGAGNPSALCAALKLTEADFALITGTSTTPVAGLGLGFDASTPLTVAAITRIYQVAWLAQTLEISVLELLSLADLTGIDPFASPVLTPASVDVPLIDFIRLAQSLSNAGLAPVQALYLLWNVDLSGTSAPAPSVVTTLAATLRSSFAAVDAQFAVTPSTSLTTAQSLMALVLGTAATDVFISLLNGTFVTSVSFGYSQSTLPPAVVTASDGQLTYDDLAKELSFQGAITPAMLTAVQTAASGDADLTTAIDSLAAANSTAVDGFLAPYSPPVSPLGLQALFEAYTSSTDPDRLTTLLDALLPLLSQQRKQQQALAAISAAAGCDPAFAAGLLGSDQPITSATSTTVPGVDDLVAMGQGGLTVAYFYGNDPMASPDLTLDVAAPFAFGAGDSFRAAADPGSAPFATTVSGYLSAPQAGDYDLQFALDPGVTVTVTVAGAVVAGTVDSSGMWSNTSAVALSDGTLTPLAVTVTGLSETFALDWQTVGTGWQPVPASALFSTASVANLGVTYLRFLKVTSLAADLSLGASDLGYLGATPEITVGGGNWITTLAVAGPAAPADAGDLTHLLDCLLTYATLKAGSAPQGTAFLDAVTAMVADGDTSQLVSITGWNGDSLAALTAQLFPEGVGATDVLVSLGRLGESLGYVGTCGVSASTLLAAAGNDPAEATVEALQAALRSRLTEDDWIAAVTPINNTLREQQRDALVAYILVQQGAEVLAALGIEATPNRVATSDDLFNYFLMDAEMEPCMLTSRVRHALSSVQLFIERCIRNLEPDVFPSDIAVDEWDWRKRYRVWQANREVFLWPENWLDPSLRDDQSPIFQTILSQLLQSDISDDAAASAFLDYLSNLELVAKLEPCGLYYGPESSPGAGDDVAHVVSRTSGAHRKHYYRAYTAGSWGPWEEVKLQIEDIPVMPYVWNGRLILFWLQLHQRGGVTASNLSQNMPSDPSNEKLTSMDTNDLSSHVSSAAAKQTAPQYAAVLCFSEYYNGTWQPMKTSDVQKPMDLQLDDGTGAAFDRTQLVLRPWTAYRPKNAPSDWSDDSLYLQITLASNEPLGDWDAMAGHYGSTGDWEDTSGFVLHNTHSSPLRWSDIAPVQLAYPTSTRQMSTSAGLPPTTLSATYAITDGGGYYPYGEPWYSSPTDWHVRPTPDTILQGQFPQNVRQVQSDLAATDQWESPFLFEDSKNVFYVKVSPAVTDVVQFNGVQVDGNLLANQVADHVDIPELVANGTPVPTGGPVESGVTRVLQGDATVSFQGRVVNATGSEAAPSLLAGLDTAAVEGGA